MEKSKLKKDLLSSKPYKEIQVQKLRQPSFEFALAYEYYLILYAKHLRGRDCLIIDTKTDSVTHSKLALDMQMNRKSPAHWRDNIFVCYGQNSSKKYQVALLYVMKNELEITFKTETINIDDPQCPQAYHPIQVYKDNLYVIVEGKETMDLWRYDLNERKWSQCEVTGEVPKTRSSCENVFFEDRIYLFGGAIKKGGEGVVIFDSTNTIPVNDLSVLDIDNMKWERIYQENFLSINELRYLKAEVIGENIYIRPQIFPGSFIYNPARNFIESEGASPDDTFSIRTYQNYWIFYREFVEQGTEEVSIRYYSFQMSETKIERNPLLVSHMEMLWKEKPFADITFIVEGEEIQAHRAILLKCRYFQDLFKSDMVEANSTKISVPGNISVENFKAILEYIYRDKIVLTEPLALELVVLSAMYFLEKMKVDCEDYLSKNLSVENFLSVLNVAEAADSKRLKKKVVSFLVGNIQKVKEEVNVQKIPTEVWIQALLYERNKFF